MVGVSQIVSSPLQSGAASMAMLQDPTADVRALYSNGHSNGSSPTTNGLANCEAKGGTIESLLKAVTDLVKAVNTLVRSVLGERQPAAGALAGGAAQTSGLVAGDAQSIIGYQANQYAVDTASAGLISEQDLGERIAGSLFGKTVDWLNDPAAVKGAVDALTTESTLFRGIAQTFDLPKAASMLGSFLGIFR